ncbi:hypothetical protein OE88DRAFT_1465194 [Heliocybe sulcata]|uniref:Uncharacterized protein n=1 Tax=Heliocybe sulcata TaxID=5364 RepID=A0A5C3N392_9AGAM|nr:hypothetical protein OE88DRAFT_1465194 [Heliocybe sulcata]
MAELSTLLIDEPSPPEESHPAPVMAAPAETESLTTGPWYARASEAPVDGEAHPENTVSALKQSLRTLEEDDEHSEAVGLVKIVAVEDREDVNVFPSHLKAVEGVVAVEVVEISQAEAPKPGGRTEDVKVPEDVAPTRKPEHDSKLPSAYVCAAARFTPRRPCVSFGEENGQPGCASDILPVSLRWSVARPALGLVEEAPRLRSYTPAGTPARAIASTMRNKTRQSPSRTPGGSPPRTEKSTKTRTPCKHPIRARSWSAAVAVVDNVLLLDSGSSTERDVLENLLCILPKIKRHARRPSRKPCSARRAVERQDHRGSTERLLGRRSGDPDIKVVGNQVHTGRHDGLKMCPEVLPPVHLPLDALGLPPPQLFTTPAAEVVRRALSMSTHVRESARIFPLLALA